jgi:ABC-type phosphate/phosphonate transport system substrate-binding protein
MARKVLITVVVAAISVFLVTGCKKGPSEDQSGQPEIKTSAEYEAEAESEITEENMAKELEKMEKELEAELGRGQ